MLTLLAYKLGNDGTRNNVSQIDMEDSRIRSIPHFAGCYSTRYLVLESTFWTKS